MREVILKINVQKDKLALVLNEISNHSLHRERMPRLVRGNK
jgi:hypothetical protein